LQQNNVFFIAEIGINHNGDLNLAKQLIDLAAEEGCDAVKFQKRDIDTVYTKEFLDSYRESLWGSTQRDQKRGLEFGYKEYKQIDTYCKLRGISWFGSAWDVKSLRFLNQFGVPYNKVASAMITNVDFLKQVARLQKFTFISTGMCEGRDIDKAVEIFSDHKCPFVLMHCVSTYPCPNEDCNVQMVKTLYDTYGCEVGYSGHEHGINPSVLAVALGATVIERHITLDRSMYGSDQSASLERDGLHRLIRDCNDVKGILGDGVKRFGEKEQNVASKLRYWDG